MDQEFEYTAGESKKSLINHYPLLKHPDFLKYVRISLAMVAYFSSSGHRNLLILRCISKRHKICEIGKNKIIN